MIFAHTFRSSFILLTLIYLQKCSALRTSDNDSGFFRRRSSLFCVGVDDGFYETREVGPVRALWFRLRGIHIEGACNNLCQSLCNHKGCHDDFAIVSDGLECVCSAQETTSFCGEHAVCVADRCLCSSGYIGDPYDGCYERTQAPTPPTPTVSPTSIERIKPRTDVPTISPTATPTTKSPTSAPTIPPPTTEPTLTPTASPTEQLFLCAPLTEYDGNFCYRQVSEIWLPFEEACDEDKRGELQPAYLCDSCYYPTECYGLFAGESKARIECGINFTPEGYPYNACYRKGRISNVTRPRPNVAPYVLSRCGVRASPDNSDECLIQLSSNFLPEENVCDEQDRGDFGDEYLCDNCTFPSECRNVQNDTQLVKCTNSTSSESYFSCVLSPPEADDDSTPTDEDRFICADFANIQDTNTSGLCKIQTSLELKPFQEVCQEDHDDTEDSVEYYCEQCSTLPTICYKVDDANVAVQCKEYENSAGNKFQACKQIFGGPPPPTLSPTTPSPTKDPTQNPTDRPTTSPTWSPTTISPTTNHSNEEMFVCASRGVRETYSSASGFDGSCLISVSLTPVCRSDIEKTCSNSDTDDQNLVIYHCDSDFPSDCFAWGAQYLGPITCREITDNYERTYLFCTLPTPNDDLDLEHYCATLLDTVDDNHYDLQVADYAISSSSPTEGCEKVFANSYLDYDKYRCVSKIQGIYVCKIDQSDLNQILCIDGNNGYYHCFPIEITASTPTGKPSDKLSAIPTTSPTRSPITTGSNEDMFVCASRVDTPTSYVSASAPGGSCLIHVSSTPVYRSELGKTCFTGDAGDQNVFVYSCGSDFSSNCVALDTQYLDPITCYETTDEYSGNAYLYCTLPRLSEEKKYNCAKLIDDDVTDGYFHLNAAADAVSYPCPQGCDSAFDDTKMDHYEYRCDLKILGIYACSTYGGSEENQILCFYGKDGYYYCTPPPSTPDVVPIECILSTDATAGIDYICVIQDEPCITPSNRNLLLSSGVVEGNCTRATLSSNWAPLEEACNTANTEDGAGVQYVCSSSTPSICSRESSSPWSSSSTYFETQVVCNDYCDLKGNRFRACHKQ